MVSYTLSLASRRGREDIGLLFLDSTSTAQTKVNTGHVDWFGGGTGRGMERVETGIVGRRHEVLHDV